MFKLILYFNCIFNWFACCIPCDVRRFCMEIKTYLLDNETNVLYNHKSFLIASSLIPYVESVY